eukprot:COSAG02_NODE_3705_length_6355_cov_10.524946_2_plen_203_part_00
MPHFSSLLVQNKTLKGKKVDVPGQKNKKKVGEDGTLLVGAMGIKIMDGPDVVASYLLQKLVSWEATGDVLRIGLDDKNWVEFVTDDGSEICEDILTIAKQLVSQKKEDEKKREDEKAAAVAARREKGIRDFDVTQTFWSKKKKSKVPPEVGLSVGIDGIDITGALLLPASVRNLLHFVHSAPLIVPSTSQLRSMVSKRRSRP